MLVIFLSDFILWQFDIKQFVSENYNNNSQNNNGNNNNSKCNELWPTLKPSVVVYVVSGLKGCRFIGACSITDGSSCLFGLIAYKYPITIDLIVERPIYIYTFFLERGWLRTRN